MSISTVEALRFLVQDLTLERKTYARENKRTGGGGHSTYTLGVLDGLDLAAQVADKLRVRILEDERRS
jgi:hypothetical protein